MTKEPLVSVIIPNYNHQEYLNQRIDSILNQSFQDFEIILLDDKSTDNSLDILKSYAKHEKVSHLIINEKNSGSPFKQWFKGINLAKGKYIWIAESDDYSSPLFLEKTVKKLKSELRPDIVFVGTTNVNSANENIGNTTRIERKHNSLLSKNFFMKGKNLLFYFIPDYCIIRNVSSSIFKKEIIERIPKTILNFYVIGDFYFWTKLCLQKNSFMYLSEKLNFMRNHFNNVRNNKQLSRKKNNEFKKIHLRIFWDINSSLKIKFQILKFYILKMLFL